jgi:hypothetical protein
VRWAPHRIAGSLARQHTDARYPLPRCAATRPPRHQDNMMNSRLLMISSQPARSAATEFVRCRACNPWTRSIAATCGSTSGGPRAEPRTFANTPRSSSFQKSSWHRAVRSSGRCYRRPYRAGSVHADPRSGRRRLCREPGEARPQCHGIPRSITGTNAKWLEVLREIVSHVTQTAVLHDRAIYEGLGQFP